MTQVESMPSRRFRAAFDVDWNRLCPLNIIHVGQSSVLLESADRRALIPVTWADRGLAPGGFALDVSDGEHLRRRLLDRQALPGGIDLRSWGRSPAGRCVLTDLRLPSLRIDPVATSRAAGLLARSPRTGRDAAMDPAVQRALAPVLASAVVDGDAGRAAAVAHDLIGSGPGATPAGDDVIVGALAGLRLAADQGLLPACARAARSALETAVRDGSHRTTTVSRHQLGAALRGSFAERTLHMAGAVADVEAVQPAHDAALGWGATSGVDFLHGLVAMAGAVMGRVPARLPVIARA